MSTYHYGDQLCSMSEVVRVPSYCMEVDETISRTESMFSRSAAKVKHTILGCDERGSFGASYALSNQ